MRRVTLLVVLVAFAFSCGGEWPVLQGLAWANMVREYAEMVPLTQAVQMTLSGDYPCAICKAIAERKQTENAKAVTLDKQPKQVFPRGLKVAAAPVATSQPRYASFDQTLRFRTEAPPTPPPRLA